MKTVIVNGRNSMEFLQEVFALFAAGKVFAIRRDGLDLGDLPGIDIVEERTPGDTRGWGKLQFDALDATAPAQIMFSSGTEGRPKPIVLSARNLSDVVRRLSQAQGLNDQVREYIGVPVTFSFGLARARVVASVGGSFFLPDRFDPSQIREMLAAGEINAISAVPTLWRIVLDAPEVIGAAGEKVRWIEIGSQYMSGSEKAAMKALFPNASIVQHYGLTEASRTTFLDVSVTEDPGILESVGTATPPAEVEIGPEGNIRIRGDHVALGILNDTGGINPVVDENGWLNTGDGGEMRNGHLHFLGRLDDQMNVGGINLAAERLERDIAALLAVPAVLAVTGVPDRMRGDAVLLAIPAESAAHAELIKAAAEVALKGAGIEPAGSLHVLQIDALPVTGSGKVQRKQLRAMYADRAATPPKADPGFAVSLTDAQKTVADAWKKVVGGASIGPDNSFYDCGGDSLSAVQIGIVMERTFDRAQVRATLEGRTLAEVAAIGGKEAPAPAADLPRSTVESWAINAVRGFMVLAVLLSHWGPGLFSRLGVEREADALLAVIYKTGTQGFATIFGVGIGYFFLPGYADNPGPARRRLRAALILVGAGLTLMAVTRIALFNMQGLPVGGLLISQAFYNVLAYYVLGLVTARFWLDGLSKTSRVIEVALIVAVCLWAVTVLSRPLLPPQQDSLLEWIRLMTFAGYNYFRLTAIVFIGIAAGYWLSKEPDPGTAALRMAIIGFAGMATAFMIGHEVYPDAFELHRRAPMLGGLLGTLIYISLTLALIGVGIFLTLRWRRLPSFARWPMQVLIVTGGLALPMFAFHGVVIPAKDILMIVGLPSAAALLIPVSLFLLVMGWMWLRLKRMYF